MARRSAPPSSRWVANEWRSVCGEIRAGTGSVTVDADRWGGSGDPGYLHWR